MHWEKSSPAAASRPRPYQGVRVRDPVKELLRKKRSLELLNHKPPQSTADAATQNIQATFPPAVFTDSPLEGVASDQQGAGWKAAPPCVSGVGLQAAAALPRSPSDYGQQEHPGQTLDHLYMQTLCPSYTMLTYTHTPLITNFGTIPVAPGQPALPPMERPDSGLAYLPWAQSLTAISTVPSPGVQFAPAAARPGSSLVHMPLSMSLTAMIPQLEPPCIGPHPQILDLLHPDHQLDPGAQGQALSADPEVESETPSLLDKILEDRKKSGEEEDKDSFTSSIFIPDV